MSRTNENFIFRIDLDFEVDRKRETVMVLKWWYKADSTQNNSMTKSTSKIEIGEPISLPKSTGSKKKNSLEWLSGSTNNLCYV